MSTIRTLCRNVFIPLLIIACWWCIIAPSLTLAAEDQYKLPGWACKPGENNDHQNFRHVKYQQLKGHVYNTSAGSALIVCPLHVKPKATSINRVTVSYTNNHRQDIVYCILRTGGRNMQLSGIHEGTKVDGRPGPYQGSFTITPRTSGKIYYLECSLPGRTEQGFSSISGIHVYQKLRGKKNCGPGIDIFDCQGIDGPLDIPGIACRPVQDAPGINYAYASQTGILWNNHKSRPLQVVCPLVRDDLSSKKSPSVLVTFANRNPGGQYRASCTLWITGPSKGKKQGMRWRDPDGDGIGVFETINTRRFPITANDTYSVECNIPPSPPPARNSGILMVELQEK